MNRSLEVVMTHPAYEEASQKLMSLFNVNTENFSTADQIAAVVYEAATDGKDQVRYVAGEDAKALYAQRNALGNEAFRGEMRKMVFGN
jgi:hypothetical protein